MDPQILKLIKSFESETKSPRLRYNEFLGHVYTTFDKNISLCGKDNIMNKYKKMRKSVLNYIIAHEKEVILILSK
jgi:hypothetical protein